MRSFIFKIGLLALCITIIIYAISGISITDIIIRSFIIFITVTIFSAVVVLVVMIFMQKIQKKDDLKKKESRELREAREKIEEMEKREKTEKTAKIKEVVNIKEEKESPIELTDETLNLNFAENQTELSET